MLGNDKSSFQESGDEAEEVFLNLTPMIDILTCLLFFLLLSFGAVIIALVNASVPVISDGDADPTVRQDKVTAGLSLTDKGMLLTFSHDKMSEQELGTMKRFYAKTPKGYDFVQLHDYLLTIKKRFSGSSSIIITPTSQVTYEDIVGAMDASRDHPITKNNEPYRLPLFPEAVISTLVE
jgi:biopolymer transport protein ExbD